MAWLVGILKSRTTWEIIGFVASIVLSIYGGHRWGEGAGYTEGYQAGVDSGFASVQPEIDSLQQEILGLRELLGPAGDTLTARHIDALVEQRCVAEISSAESRGLARGDAQGYSRGQREGRDEGYREGVADANFFNDIFAEFSEQASSLYVASVEGGPEDVLTATRLILDTVDRLDSHRVVQEQVFNGPVTDELRQALESEDFEELKSLAIILAESIDVRGAQLERADNLLREPRPDPED